MIWLERAVLVMAIASTPICLMWSLLNWTIDTGEPRTFEYVAGPLMIPALGFLAWWIVRQVRLERENA
jgi:hypothetical protein